MLLQFLWLCGRDTDGSTSIMDISNPGYGEYTIYGIVYFGVVMLIRFLKYIKYYSSH